jgi:nucleoid DNA-binding protein
LSTVNRKEIARRIAHRGGYNIGDIEGVLEMFEDVVVEALEDGDTVKLGKLFKLFLEKLPEKNAYDGLNKRYFIRESKRVPKAKLLKRLTDIELPVTGEEEEE